MITAVRRVWQAMDSNAPVLGPMIFEFATPVVAALAHDSGAQFLIVDMEQTIFDFATVQVLVTACNYEGLASIVRLPSLVDTRLVGKVLDFGATGVMAPMIGSRAEAERLVAATRYPPCGTRGMAHGAPGPGAERGEQRELRPVVIAQIESREGLAQVDAIADVDGIDVLWIGQRDLSLALGVPGQFDSAPFVDDVRHIARAANDAGKSAGYLLESPEHAQKLTALGYRWFGFSDTALYSSALGTRLQQVRDLLNGEMRR
ncbi:MAG TPA: aldolase/citrate lyase family protein [Mycobacterium sp.]|nr:aldolase/citrate lyase family protein [Mycobacterium sp.]HUH69492.1 aldolase/citrate lyase family protein [Mycobacterium sp.]